MRLIYKIILFSLFLQGLLMQDIYGQNNKTKFTVEVKNSIGEPQMEAFIKISGRSDIYKPDSCGIIKFEYEVPKSYKRTANIYTNQDKEKPIKTFNLEENNNSLFFTVDTKDNLLEFKKDNNTFSIEGIVTDNDGNPIEGAVVSIQGTGRYAFTDEIGLFSIEADYNHNIIIRAEGMDNLSLNVTPFLSNQKEAFNIKMKPKSDEKIYSNMEKRPQYPGGMRYFKNYIDRNLKYPEKAKMDSIEGVVVMQFIVEKDGNITSPRIVRTLESSLDSIAMNLIRNMPRWIPGSDNGKTVRCKYSVPIAFRIPRPKPVVDNKDTIKGDSIKILNDSLISDSLSIDSLDNKIVKNDSLLSDSIMTDSLVTAKTDSLVNDSIKSVNINEPVKVKKRNVFVRFFRWLFGIKDKGEKTKSPEINEEDMKNEKDIKPDDNRNNNSENVMKDDDIERKESEQNTESK